MKKNNLPKIALFLIYLILTLPFYASNVLATIDKYSETIFENKDFELKSKSEKIDLLQERISELNQGLLPITGRQVSDTSEFSLPEAPEACIDKNKQTHSLVDLLDNEIISILEKIVAILHAISSAWLLFKTATNVVIKTLLLLKITIPAAEALDKALRKMGLFFDPITAFVSCDWKNAFPPANLLPNVKWCEFDKFAQQIPGLGATADSPGFSTKIGPYDNIYLAIGCLCPTAILFNIRKLKTIYQTYNCCVEQACYNGLSTEGCERQLSEATCMFWEGSIFSAIIKIMMSLAAYFLATYLLAPVLSRIVTPAVLNLVLDIIAIPGQWRGLLSSIQWVSRSFSEPSCDDLGFDKLKKERKLDLQRNCFVRQIDLNNDGIIDKTERVCT